MPLYTFGGTPSDVLTDAAGNVVPNYPVLIRVAGTGELITALFEVDGTTPIGELRTNILSSSAPGAIRSFKADAQAIEYEYLDGNGQPVRWYQAGRELAAAALQAAEGFADDLDDKLDKTGGTVTGDLTIEGALSAPNVLDAPAARLFVVTGAVGNGVADDRAVIQTQLDAAHTAGGGIVLIPGGKTYGVSTFLVVYDSTTIWAYGATLKATANSGLLRNFLDSETFAAYAGHSRISVLGGTWDGNASDAGVGTVTSTTNIMNWVHASDITVRDATFMNTSSAHACEFNAVDGGRVENCRFLGFKDNSGTRAFSEAVQIDMAKSGSSSIGLFDNTPSKNIRVEGCYFGASSRLASHGRAVGSHTAAAGVTFDNIQVIGNRIDAMGQEGVFGFGWRRAAIADNVITGCGMSGISAAMYDYSSIATSPHTLAIHGNTVEGSASDSGIRVVGDTGYKMPGVSISSNVVRDITGNAIHAEHCAAPDISGNQCDDTTSTGIYAHLSDGAVVSSNVMRNAGSNGINVSGTVGACVTGNTIDTTATNFGIFVGQSGSTDSTDALVSGNTVNAAFSAGIRCSTDAARCTVTGNKVRKGGVSANGITLAATAVDCVVTNNDVSGNAWSAATAFAFTTAAPITGPGNMTAVPGSNLVDTDLTALPALEAALRPTGRYETTSRLRCGTASTPTSGSLYLVPIWLPKGFVVSSITFTSGGTAAVTPTNYWFTLHNSSRVALARTADQTTTAWAANTIKTLAVAQTTAGAGTSYTTTYSGLHYLGVMVKATTQPNLVGEGSVADVVASVSPGFGGTDTGMTTPPTVTAGAFTAGAFGAGSGIMAYAYVA